MESNWELQEAISYYRTQALRPPRKRWWRCCGKCSRKTAAYSPMRLSRKSQLPTACGRPFFPPLSGDTPPCVPSRRRTGWSCAAGANCARQSSAALRSAVGGGLWRQERRNQRRRRFFLPGDGLHEKLRQRPQPQMGRPALCKGHAGIAAPPRFRRVCAGFLPSAACLPLRQGRFSRKNLIPGCRHLQPGSKFYSFR